MMTGHWVQIVPEAGSLGDDPVAYAIEQAAKMPAGEQFIGARDVSFYSVMHQIAEALEYLNVKSRRRPAPGA